MVTDYNHPIIPVVDVKFVKEFGEQRPNTLNH